MSRFPTVQAMVCSTGLAGQVGTGVRLVASRLAGSAWWNDEENERRGYPMRLTAVSLIKRS
jgi:hypothetical protein